MLTILQFVKELNIIPPKFVDQYTKKMNNQRCSSFGMTQKKFSTKELFLEHLTSFRKNGVQLYKKVDNNQESLGNNALLKKFPLAYIEK